MSSRADEPGALLSSLRAVGRLFLRLPPVTGPLLVVLWGGVIWSLSAMEGGDMPPNFWKSWLNNSAHAPLFGFLAFLSLVAFPRNAGWPVVGRFAVLLTMASVGIYAGVDEWHQSQVAGRDASGLDVLTDTVGAGVTLWVAGYLGVAEATGRGVALRLALGLSFCALAGLTASLV
ncbi:MAG: hypothetical protein ACI9F9_003122 [Candidatus Paceibacteria bacterium]|jgi:hypothetical protein